MLCAVTVEEMPQQPAIQIRGPEHPIRDREGQVHIHFHHQARVVMRSVMAAQCVDEGAITHEPVFVDMTAEMHELIA